MARIDVQHCLREFEKSINGIDVFLREARGFYKVESNLKYIHVGIRRVELFAGLSLLNIYLAWEHFIENVFIRYMCGAKSPSGFSPSLITSREKKISNAMSNLLGSGRRYLNWSTQEILDRAGVYFDHGEPFTTAISAISQTLGDIIIIRNRFAHRSDFAIGKFRSVVIKSIGYVPRGINPGRFLLTVNTDPTAMGQTYIEFYSNSLVAAGLAIVPS